MDDEERRPEEAVGGTTEDAENRGRPDEIISNISALILSLNPYSLPDNSLAENYVPLFFYHLLSISQVVSNTEDATG